MQQNLPRKSNLSEAALSSYSSITPPPLNVFGSEMQLAGRRFSLTANYYNIARVEVALQDLPRLL